MSANSSQQQIEADLMGTLHPFRGTGRVGIIGLSVIILWGLYAYITQLTYGLSMTGMRDCVTWGCYIANFVFFIGISHAGTLISAILRVTHAEWRRPITRMAEAITVFALMVGAPMVIIDMGRPDRILNVFQHGRLQSPILWDICSIATYLTGSLLYLYIALIPDLAMLRDRFTPTSIRRRVYRVLAIGYEGTPKQRERLDRALAVMAVIIIPVAVSVHTVVSWIFGMTLRPGWHSTIFGPYFVVGAIYSGTAAIITAMAFFRWGFRLEKYLTPGQFRNLGTLLLALGLIYSYFTLSEYLTIWYGSESIDQRLIANLMTLSGHGILFWTMIFLGLFLPTIFLLLWRNSLAMIVIASLLVNIGMWVKRYLIVVATLQTPYIHSEAGNISTVYFPTWVEWSITLAAFAVFILFFMSFAKIFPIVSIWETVEGVEQGTNTTLKGTSL